MIRTLALAGLSLAVVGLTLTPFMGGRSRAAEAELTSPQSDYLEHCGGCHGLQGDTTPAQVPVLRGRVGYFMCTQAGRRYLIRLPNIAHSRIDDDQRLAEMMNFVVFGLGGSSAPLRAKAFTAAEVTGLRGDAMSGPALLKTRAVVVKDLIKSCGAPASLRYFYPGQENAAGH